MPRDRSAFAVVLIPERLPSVPLAPMDVPGIAGLREVIAALPPEERDTP